MKAEEGFPSIDNHALGLSGMKSIPLIMNAGAYHKYQRSYDS